MSTTKDVWTNVDMERGHFYDEWVTKEDKADEEDEEYDGSEYQMRWMSFCMVFLLFCLILKYFHIRENKKQAVLGVIAWHKQNYVNL